VKITLLRQTEVEEAYHKCYNGHIDIGLSLDVAYLILNTQTMSFSEVKYKLG